MRKLAVVVFLVSSLWMVSAIAEEATKLREEISVPVDYQGRQIQLTGWFEKPATAGPFPVVIVLHSCSGYYASMAGGSLPGWVGFLQQQGYATFKFDSFTARGQSEVCASNAVTAGDRAADVLVAAALLVGRRDVRRDRIAVIGFSHGGGTAVYVARDHMELRPLRAQLAARGGRLVASIGLYPGCGQPGGQFGHCAAARVEGWPRRLDTGSAMRGAREHAGQPLDDHPGLPQRLSRLRRAGHARPLQAGPHAGL